MIIITITAVVIIALAIQSYATAKDVCDKLEKYRKENPQNKSI